MLLARDCTLINLTRQFSTRYSTQVNYVQVPSRQADYQNQYFWSTETWNWSWLLNQISWSWTWSTFEMWGLLSVFVNQGQRKRSGGTWIPLPVESTGVALYNSEQDAENRRTPAAFLSIRQQPCTPCKSLPQVVTCNSCQVQRFVLPCLIEEKTESKQHIGLRHQHEQK